MTKMQTLAHDRLTEVLDYDPATGIFVWKIRPSNRVKAGDVAGAPSGKYGLRFINVDGSKLQANRLAWFYVNREWPKGDVKFLNGDSDDCSIANLRDASRIEQARARGALTTNTSGFRGVSPTRRGKWKASITANYHQIMLGVFSTREEASEIYEHAAAILAPARTTAECETAAQAIIQYRRKRVAWSRLERSGRPHAWADFESFCADVGEMSDDESTVAALNEAMPIGPGNFRWLLRPEGKFDRSTKAGRAAYAKAYRASNPGRWRHAHLKQNYKIDEVEYHRLLELYGGECPICEEEPSQRLAVDHDHTTGDVRGLMCKRCNYAMGQFGDDPKRMRRAAQFLEDRTQLVPQPFLADIADDQLSHFLSTEAAGDG